MRKKTTNISSQWKQIDPKRRLLYRNITALAWMPFFVLLMIQSLVPFVQTFEQIVLELKPLGFLGLMGERFIQNYLFFLLLYLLLFYLPKFKVTSTIVSVLFFIIGLIQHHVIYYKRQLIYPRDIQNITLLRDISSEYKLIFNRHILISIAFLAIAIGLAFIAQTREFSWKKRLIGSVVSILLLFVFVFGFALSPARQLMLDVKYKNFQPIMNVPMNGLVMTYFYYIAVGNLQVPDNYSEEKVADILDQFIYETDDIQEDSRRPHVIVIVNESLTDYEALFDIETNQPVMPFYHSLEGDNVVKMELLCSVLGGGTANTEMEILTGHSLYFFPPGSYPFLQVFHQDINSMARIYAEAGYRPIYIHPYPPTGWNRTEVVPFLGFEDGYFIDDFIEPQLVRQYVSDAEAYRFVIDQFENHISQYPDQPMFQYLLTMQNHGGYEDDQFDSLISLSHTNDYPSAEQFLSLARLSDDALEDLITYFEAVNEDVVIIYLGDHQPVFPDAFEVYLQDYYTAPHDPLLQQFITPVMFWANFDISSYTVSHSEATMISPNYVLPLISDITGINHPYTHFLNDLFTEVPCINSRGVVDTQGRYYHTGSEDMPDNIQGRLAEYEKLQYYYLSQPYIKTRS